jgi:uncharacterized repeat protein (TIGR01451 family)
MNKKLLQLIIVLFLMGSASAASLSEIEDKTGATPFCPVPSGFIISNITSSSATLEWNPGGSTEFEIFAWPDGDGIIVAEATGTMVTGNSYTATGLDPDTNYRFIIRAICGNEVSNYNSSEPFTTLPLTLVCGNTCTYTFQGFDSFGDSWNGNKMKVYQNGVVVSTLQISIADGGSQVTKTVTLCDDTPFELFWTGGYYPEEVAVSIQNSFGQTIFSKPYGAGVPNNTIFVQTVNCSNPLTCLAPIDVNFNAASSPPQLSWTATGSTQWEVLMLPVGSPEPTASSTGIVTSLNPFPVTGMLPNTAYSFYVRSICGDEQKSTWTYPISYTPPCSPPSNMLIDGFTATTATVSWQGSGTQYEVVILPVGQNPTASTTGIMVSGNQYSATGLTTNQEYRFYVRNVCGSNVTSTWTLSADVMPALTLAPLTTNTTQYTVPQLVTDVLLNNPCVNATNITWSTGTNFGSVNGIGYFVNTNPTFPLESGLILSTGNALNAPGPNTSNLADGVSSWPGDPQLESVISAATGTSISSLNATALEFDFTTLTADISFNFLFASEEYGTFQCSFSDAVAFLLTDMVSGITTNIAVVPATNVPISVVTIRDNANNSACASVNPQYFDTLFVSGLASSAATNFNGQTTAMTASASVIPNHPYHIKLVIADRGDEGFDSAVFIESGSFSVGPPECQDKIKLVAFVDGNGNGIKDNDEVNFTYGSFTYEQNNDGITHNIVSTAGDYTIYDSTPVNTYNLGYVVNPEFAPYFSVAATAFNNINIPVGSGTQTFYFPITNTQGYNDVAVTLIPLVPPRTSNADFTNMISYTNFGIAPASGTLSFTKDPALSIFSYISQPVIETPTGFTYTFANLQPYETRNILVKMNVPGLAMGDLVTNNVTVTAASGDINLANNSSSSTEAVVNSFDPNNIVEAHGEKIQFDQFSANDYLYYTINFQNIGTANAIDVRIEDLLDARLDETSVRMVSASHSYVLERVGSHLTWHFDYIQLPGVIVNEELSKGYVTFRVKLKPGFVVGTIIPNMANIYFDSNEPIATNTFNTEFVQQLSTPEITADNIIVYPNPASENITVSLTNAAGDIERIVLYDMVGKVVQKTGNVLASQATLDVSMLSNGIYLMEVVTGNQLRITKKLIIQ